MYNLGKLPPSLEGKASGQRIEVRLGSYFAGAAMNVVGLNSLVIGTLECEQDIFVAGRFEGTIVTKGTLHIYPEGEVSGKIKAKDLTVAGKIQGEIEVTNRLRVKNSASLEAHINTRFLDWEEGAELEGEVRTFY
ncbi:MAG: bactofilin family protein [Syntrophobacteria bacterium]